MEMTVHVGFAQLLEAIRKLPPEQRRSLRSVLETDVATAVTVERTFGTLKGLVTYVADDFDAPLDDFSDYS